MEAYGSDSGDEDGNDIASLKRRLATSERWRSTKDGTRVSGIEAEGWGDALELVRPAQRPLA